MKRRKFLITSAGLAGSALSGVALGQARPCPAPRIDVTGGTIANTPCDASTGSAPAWFEEMLEKSWATPVTNTLNAVRPNPLPTNNSGHAAICSAWTGGCVDQDRGEFILAANGGHLDYGGNEVYACALRAASPAWVRLTDPSAVAGGTSGNNSVGNFGDGRPRSVHGYNRCCWGNGRVWYAGLDGMYSGGGSWSTACYSFDRSTRQWTYHGLGIASPGGSFSWQGGPAAYDRIANRVWSAAQYATSNGVYSVDASSGARTPYNLVLSGNPFTSAWSVIAHDLRVWIVGSVSEGRLWILDLDDPVSGFTQKSTSGSPNAFSAGAGAVYHAPSRAIICWNGYGASLRKLSVPANPFTGTYTWSTIAPDPGNTVTPSSPQGNGTFSRFNIIEDMGNGRSALCLVNRTTEAVYVYKLPAVV